MNWLVIKYEFTVEMRECKFRRMDDSQKRWRQEHTNSFD
jgi:hypothetical protein